MWSSKGYSYTLHLHEAKSTTRTCDQAIDVYARCGEIENFVKFVDLPEQNDVTRSIRIVGYVQLGDGEKAMNLFSYMLGYEYDVQPTEVTLLKF